MTKDEADELLDELIGATLSASSMPKRDSVEEARKVAERDGKRYRECRAKVLAVMVGDSW